MAQVSILEVPRLQYYPMKNIVYLKELFVCSLKFKKTVIMSKSFPHIPFCFSLYKSPLCHALVPNVFKMYKNIPRTSRPWPKESRGIKSDWLGDMALLSVNSSYYIILLLYSLLYNIVSNSFPATGSKDIRRYFF